jgi:hypothetical protein
MEPGMEQRGTVWALRGKALGLHGWGGTDHMLKAITIGLALIATPAIAQTENKVIATGNDMFPSCFAWEQIVTGQSNTPPATTMDAYTMGRCNGMVQGIRYLMNSATKAGDHPTCMPDKVTPGQLMSVVVRYMRNHPEHLHHQFELLVYDAYREAWPCKRQ